MKRLILKKMLTAITYLIAAIFIEVLLFAILGWGIFPSYFLFDLCFMLGASLLIFGLKYQKISVILALTLLIIQVILAYVNICVYSTLNDVFSFSMIGLASETTQVLTSEMFPIIPIVVYTFLIGIIFIIFSEISRIKVDKNAVNEFNKLIIKTIMYGGLCAMIIVYCCQPLLLNNSNYLLGDYRLYTTFQSNKLSLQKFGSFGFYTKQLTDSVAVSQSTDLFSREDAEEFLSTEEYNPTESELWNKAEGQNLLVIMAESFEWYGISKELTPTIYALINGYDFYSEEKSDYDLNFYEKDVNGELILSSMDYSKYDESKQNNYGTTLANFYSKAKTDQSEASVILGNYPYNESFVTYSSTENPSYSSTGIYNGNNFNFSLPNILKDSNKIDCSKYFHSYLSSFYGRKNTMSTFGFDSSLFLDETTGLKKGLTDGSITTEDNCSNYSLTNACLDSEYCTKYKDEICPVDKTFFSFYTTITTHGSYKTQKKLLTEHYKYVDENIDYIGENTEDEAGSGTISDQIRTYLASCLDTEYAVATLVNDLMQKGIFNNTIIAFYADHQSYYSNLDLVYKNLVYGETGFNIGGNQIYCGEYGFNNPARYSVPAFIYSTALDSTLLHRQQFCSKFTNAFDISATILAMLGVDYNTHYYVGYPLLLIKDGKELGQASIISHTGGIFNDWIYTENGMDPLVLKQGKTSEDVKNFTTSIMKQLEKRLLINVMYQNNMFE